MEGSGILEVGLSLTLHDVNVAPRPQNRMAAIIHRFNFFIVFCFDVRNNYKEVSVVCFSCRL